MAEEKTTVVAEETEAKKPAAKKTTTPRKPRTTTKKTETVEEAPKAKKTTAKKTTTKKATAAKKETKKVEPAKPTRTEATARAVSLKVTPRKARLVIDLVRGKNVRDALNILNNTNHKAAPLIAKLVKSAYANAVNNFGLEGDRLYISNIQASDSIKMKRYLPRAKGSASGLVKRFSNVFVTVKER